MFGIILIPPVLCHCPLFIHVKGLFGGGWNYIIPPVYAIAFSCVHVRGNYCKDKVETDLANRNQNEWCFSSLSLFAVFNSVM